MLKQQEYLDVTKLEPRQKHPKIFEIFDQLTDGSSLVIHNDHDPKPLYYQLLAERGDSFEWTYLVNGPMDWEVEITKGKNPSASTKIGEIVKKDFRKAQVFKKFGIDFCCGGKKTLKQACEENKLDILELQKELEQIENSDANQKEIRFDEMELDELCTYIIEKHHRYVGKTIPVIFEYTQKVARVHGERNPELIEIADLFMKISHELNCHMMKEEKMLFPYISSMAIAKREKNKAPMAQFGTVSNPIQVMEDDHEEVGKLMKKIEELSQNYTAPSNACTTYRISYESLKEFAEDLYQHIHLENNILFPKAEELEKTLN